MLALGVFQHFSILRETMGKGTEEESDTSSLILEVGMASENTSSSLLSGEATDPQVILLVTTSNYLEKLASKEFGNKLGLTKVVDQFCQQRANGRMPRSPS